MKIKKKVGEEKKKYEKRIKKNTHDWYRKKKKLLKNKRENFFYKQLIDVLGRLVRPDNARPKQLPPFLHIFVTVTLYTYKYEFPILPAD